MQFRVVTVNYSDGEYNTEPTEPKTRLIFNDAKALEEFLNDKHPTFTNAVVVVLPEAKKETAPTTDSQRLDWLEKQVKKSRTGISFDWVPSVEGQGSGWRYMHHHYIGDVKSSLRDAIDNTMKLTS
jgi:hypothetical protein